MTRVVVYAEGAGELAGSITQLPPVGEPLREEHLGAAHELVRRALIEEWNVAPEAIRFDQPQNKLGRLVKGSDLLHERTLRQLLVWAKPTQQPDVALVLVDADGDRQRGPRLRSAISTFVKQRTVVAVAVQEFEAWLLADDEAVSNVVGETIAPVTDLEALPSGAAKQKLMELLSARGRDGRRLRRELASKLRLERLRDRCPAFNDLLQDLRAARPSS